MYLEVPVYTVRSKTESNTTCKYLLGTLQRAQVNHNIIKLQKLI